MLTIYFHNDKTGTLKVGNYEYEVFVNTRKIAEGDVKGHYRPNGWKGLVTALQQQLAKAKDIDEFDKRLEDLYNFLSSSQSNLKRDCRNCKIYSSCNVRQVSITDEVDEYIAYCSAFQLK